MKQIILVAGGTGNLGGRIIHSLLKKGVAVRALIRAGSDPTKIQQLAQAGAQIIPVNTWSVEEIAKACEGVSCVVSALSGLRPVIIDTQKILLDAAVAAGVPRFIPSDYSLDFTGFSAGSNRNLDWRREFHTYLDSSPISATTIFNGAFADMLTAEMPLVLFNIHKILCWGDPNQRMDFTTVQNTAEFTANAALDASTPRFLRIAGDQISCREIQAVASEVSGKKYGMIRPGGLGVLGVLIKIARTIAPGKEDLYPAWQGMQYMHNMMDGRGEIKQPDNNRYPNMHWTTVKDVLTARQNSLK